MTPPADGAALLVRDVGKTFRAADASEYLRTEFAPFERRTTKSGSDSWTGLYFYGESTYFEFLAAER